MSSKEYHRILQHTDSEMAHQNKDAHKSGSSGNCRLPQLHQDYEYFQLFDPDDSDIDDESDPDIRSLLVSKITSYAVLTKTNNSKSCCLSPWYKHFSCAKPRIRFMFKLFTISH